MANIFNKQKKNFLSKLFFLPQKTTRDLGLHLVFCMKTCSTYIVHRVGDKQQPAVHMFFLIYILQTEYQYHHCSNGCLYNSFVPCFTSHSLPVTYCFATCGLLIHIYHLQKIWLKILFTTHLLDCCLNSINRKNDPSTNFWQNSNSDPANDWWMVFGISPSEGD